MIATAKRETEQNHTRGFIVKVLQKIERTHCILCKLQVMNELADLQYSTAHLFSV